MKKHSFKYLIATMLLCCSVLPACVSTSSLSGKTDIPMLVPEGKAAKWKLRVVEFDKKENPAYRMSWKNPTRLDGQYRIGVMAHAKMPKVPKTFNPDGYSSETKPIDFSQEIFIPAIGRKVAYYCDSGGGGSENATFSTLPIAWPDGHGGTIYYVIWVESDEPEKILPKVKWSPPGSMANAKIPEELSEN